MVERPMQRDILGEKCHHDCRAAAIDAVTRSKAAKTAA